MNPWIIADTHLGHVGLTEDGFRPAGFSERIIKSLTNVLKPGDLLIHLGDVCFGDDEKWNRALTSLPGKKWLLIGSSHDKKSMTWYIEHGWDWVGESMVLNVFGKRILFSHVPQVVESSALLVGHYSQVKYDLNIHGHFHTFGMATIEEKEPELFKILTPKHHLVALETLHYVPVKLKTIVERRV
jgi:calcineurin-like phosphoesterase family protein